MSAVICHCPKCKWQYVGNVVNIKCPNCDHSYKCKEATRVNEPIKPIDFQDWPWWAKQVAKRKEPTDRGVGDTVERLAAKVGGKQFKAWTERLGIPCGCTTRRDEWNQKYPYPQGDPE